MRSNDTYDILDDGDERPRRGFWDDDDDFRRGPRRKKALPNSGFGIASLVIGLIVGATDFISLVVAGILEKEGAQADDSNEAIVILVVLLVGFVFSLIGGALAIISLVQAKRAKGYAIAGLVINSLVVLGMLGIIVIGLLMG
jgi:hypothetical protein